MRCPSCDSYELFAVEIRGIERKTTQGQILCYICVICRCADCEKHSRFHFRKSIDLRPLRISMINMISLSTDDEKGF